MNEIEINSMILIMIINSLLIMLKLNFYFHDKIIVNKTWKHIIMVAIAFVLYTGHLYVVCMLDLFAFDTLNHNNYNVKINER